MRITATKTTASWPMTLTERDLAQAEADDWQSEFLDALRGIHATARTGKEDA